MPKMILRTIVIAMALLGGLQGQNVLAKTVVVGPDACQTGLTHYSTIQSAVSAVPAGSTVLVCPGTYPEQVVISQALTLRGVIFGTSGAAVITVPGTGLTVNATSQEWGPVTAQLLVTSTGVTISDIAVDGKGGTCVSGANRTVGILFYNVGAGSHGPTDGKVEQVVVRNQIDGCGNGEGIASDTSHISIDSNEVHDIDRSGIAGDYGENSITSNYVQNVGYYGIYLASASHTVAFDNVISNGGSPSVSLSAGVDCEEGSTTTSVLNNTIMDSPIGVLLYSASGCTVQFNKISNSTQEGLVDEYSAGGNIVTQNIVNETPEGLYQLDSTGDILDPNIFLNVTVTEDPGTTALAPSGGHKG